MHALPKSFRKNLKVSPDDAPHAGALFTALASEASGGRKPPVPLTPPFVELPETMKMQARTLPGQNGGLLGPAADPFRCEVTADAEVVPPPFGLPEGVDADRLLLRGNLRDALDRQLKAAETGFFNTLMGEFNFADLPEADLMRSIRLFGEKVIPMLRDYEPF